MESYFCPIILDLYNAKIGINILNKDNYINKLQSLVAQFTNRQTELKLSGSQQNLYWKINHISFKQPSKLHFSKHSWQKDGQIHLFTRCLLVGSKLVMSNPNFSTNKYIVNRRLFCLSSLGNGYISIYYLLYNL